MRELAEFVGMLSWRSWTSPLLKTSWHRRDSAHRRFGSDVGSDVDAVQASVAKDAILGTKCLRGSAEECSVRSHLQGTVQQRSVVPLCVLSC